MHQAAIGPQNNPLTT